MEFYFGSICEMSEAEICFNSQRDGILHKAYSWHRYDAYWFQFPTGWNSTCSHAHLNLPRLVSIPNGMEFYIFMSSSHFCRSSFNSQRDGILLAFWQFLHLSYMVSIPNGMEFYLLIYERIIQHIYCFNSQRDGILLCNTFTFE